MGTQRARFTVQKVVLLEPEAANIIRGIAETEGLSESEVIRRLIAGSLIARAEGVRIQQRAERVAANLAAFANDPLL